MADASFYISSVMTLALFDIKATEGSPTEFTQGEGGVLDGMAVWYVYPGTSTTAHLRFLLLSHPKPFPFSIKPRSAKVEALIMSIDDEL